jgi:hypothetical protein
LKRIKGVLFCGDFSEPLIGTMFKFEDPETCICQDCFERVPVKHNKDVIDQEWMKSIKLQEENQQ